MVYVNNGQVYNSAPWSLKTIYRIFDRVITFFVLFFKTLVPLESTSKQSGSGSTRGGGFSGSGGGGGGRPFGPGGGGGGGSRFRTMNDINPPTIGGCPGGACGM